MVTQISNALCVFIILIQDGRHYRSKHVAVNVMKNGEIIIYNMVLIGDSITNFV